VWRYAERIHSMTFDKHEENVSGRPSEVSN
jgi:hypothetical protein